MSKFWVTLTIVKWMKATVKNLMLTYNTPECLTSNELYNSQCYDMDCYDQDTTVKKNFLINNCAISPFHGYGRACYFSQKNSYILALTDTSSVLCN